MFYHLRDHVTAVTRSDFHKINIFVFINANIKPISFVMKMEGCTYPEAIEFLANKLGITVYHTGREKSEEEKRKEARKTVLQTAVSAVQDFFVKCLDADTPEAAKARKYAFSRWGEEYTREIGIGLAPANWDDLRDYAEKAGIDRQALLDVGILRLKEKGNKPYPFFRDRITIPIRNRSGSVVAFTARYIGDEPDQAKYMNSTDSEIFKKGELLFGLDVARKHARLKGRFVVVEGAPDVVSLQSDSVGLGETVGPLGTALTETHLKLMLKDAPAIIFLPDADPPKPGEDFGAGVRAVMKNGLAALRAGFDVSVRTIPFEEKPIVVPLFDFEIEQLEHEALSRKIDYIRKNVTRSEKKLADVRLSEQDLLEIPRTRQIGTLKFKNDPDSYISSIERFNALDDELFPVWFGTRIFETAKTEGDSLKAMNSICEECLIHVKDDTLRNTCIERLSRIYGKIATWRSALRSAEFKASKERERREKQKLSGDQLLMRELGIILKNGCYCSYDKDGALERWTNFSLEPLYHIIDGKNAIRIFRIKNDRGTVREIEFSQDELISIGQFKRRIEALGNFKFKGDPGKFDNLTEYLYSITDSATQVSKLGWDPAQRIYAFGDAIFADGALHEVDELGIIRLEDRTFYLPAFSRMHINERDSFQFERNFSAKNHGEIGLFDFLKKMVTVFGDNAKVGFAFLLVTLFSDVVREQVKIPMFNIFGQPQSGKTELGTTLMSFFIRRNDPPSMANLTVSAMNDMLSCAENNLVHLDEYKNELDFRKIEFLKKIWDGAGQTKRNMDGDKKAQTTIVRSGVILTGQDMPNRDNALFTRVVHVEFFKTSHTEQESKNFSELRGIASRGLSHLTAQLLKLRNVFEADYAAQFISTKKEFKRALEDSRVDDRVFDNWLSILAAFRTVQTSLDLPFDYKDLFEVCVRGIRAQMEKLSKNSDVAVFWQLLDANHMQGKIINRAHYVLRSLKQFRNAAGDDMDFGNEKNLIFINFQNVVTTLGQRVNGVNIVGKLDPVSLESYLRTDPAYLGTKQWRFMLLQPNGQPDYIFERRGDRTVKRLKEVRPMAMVFDYDMLKQKFDINLEVLERSPEELTEDDEAPENYKSIVRPSSAESIFGTDDPFEGM